MEEKDWLYQIGVKAHPDLIKQLDEKSQKSRSQVVREAIDQLLNNAEALEIKQEGGKRLTEDGLVPFFVYVYREQVKKLDILAQRHGVSRSALIRLALEKYLQL